MRRTALARSLALFAVLALPAPVVHAAPAAAGDISPQIVNGGYVSSAPWAAALYINGRVWCSGTIIASRWVLTAKHCADGGGSKTVRVGNVRHASGIQANVSRVHENPNGDMSLLFLNRSISTTYAQLASSDPPIGSINRIYGWGTLSNTDPSSPLSDRLKYADVRVTSTSASDYYGGWGIRSRGVTGVTGWGDSGGPQMYNGRQVGVCSTGTLTEQTYASVARNRNWIRGVSGV